jgi:hypothetical protein
MACLMDGWIDCWMDGWMDGYIDKVTPFVDVISTTTWVPQKISESGYHINHPLVYDQV